MTAGVIGRRCCAVLAVVSAALHGVMLGMGMSLAATVLTVAMLGACLFCARELCCAPTMRTWVLVAAMNLAMVALHMPVPAGHHHLGAVGTESHSTVLVIAAMLAAVEVVAAVAVLHRRSRAMAQVYVFTAPRRAPVLG